MKKRFLALTFCGILGLSGLCFAGCNEESSYHSILATSSDATNGGSVSGSGRNFKTNSQVTLVATPKQEGGFLAWVKDEQQIVSYDQVYSFTANAETEGKYTALFETQKFEFARLVSVDYHLNSFSVPNTEVKILNWDLKYNTFGTLYQPLSSFENASLTVDNPFQNITHEDKVFWAEKTYYFSLTIHMQYTNMSNGETTTEPLITTFAMDFSKIFDGTKNSNTTTFTDQNYSLQLIESANSYTFLTTFTNLKTSLLWDTNPENNRQVLNLTFVYSNPLHNNNLLV